MTYFVNHSYDYRPNCTDPVRSLISDHKHCRFYIKYFLKSRVDFCDPKNANTKQVHLEQTCIIRDLKNASRKQLPV